MKVISKDAIIVTLLIIVCIMALLLIYSMSPVEPVVKYQYQCSNGQVVNSLDLCPKIEEKVEKALVDGVINKWGENIYNPNELLFGVNVYNYGNIEAKNVVVACKVFESDEQGFVKDYSKPLLTASKNIGNIGSTSYIYKEITATNIGIKSDKTIGICAISSCDDCEKLKERIFEFKEYYKEAGFI